MTIATTSGIVKVLLPSGVWEEVRGQVHATVVSGAVRSVLVKGSKFMRMPRVVQALLQESGDAA